MKLEIRNWRHFQHYKDRRPPWVKLYVEVLDDFDEDGNPKRFRSLPDTAKLTFLMLLALASRYNGIIPTDDPQWLASHTGIAPESVNIKPLLQAEYIHASKDASNPASKVAPKVLGSETETERDTETDTETLSQRACAREVDESLPSMVAAIRDARPEYSCMTEMAVASALQACPDRARLADAVRAWVADHANAMKPYDNPLASVRKMVARAAGAEPTRARGRRGKWGDDGDDPKMEAWKRVRDDVADRIWTAKETGVDVADAMRAVRDGYRNAPKYEGIDPITAGIELATNNRRAKAAQDAMA